MRKLRLRKIIGLPITTPLHRVAETAMLCLLIWTHLSRLGRALPVPSRQQMRIPKSYLTPQLHEQHHAAQIPGGREWLSSKGPHPEP